MACVWETTTNNRVSDVSVSFHYQSFLQFDREHFSEVFVDLKWFESKVGNKYLNEAAGLAAEKEAASKDMKEVCSKVYMCTYLVYAVAAFQHCFHVQL